MVYKNVCTEQAKQSRCYNVGLEPVQRLHVWWAFAPSRQITYPQPTNNTLRFLPYVGSVAQILANRHHTRTLLVYSRHRSLCQFVWLYANVAVAQTPCSLKAGICSNMRLTSGPLTPMKGEIVQIEDVKGNWKFITRKTMGSRLQVFISMEL